MASSNSILPPGLEQLAVKPAKKKETGDLGQGDFMKLMLTQMKFQDPLKPMENGEFLSQLAQFGTVNGINELKTSFEKLASSLQSSRALQASTMVGRSVLVDSSDFTLDATGSGVHGAVDLQSTTDNLVLTVSDQFGQYVKTINMGTLKPGIVNFTWEGMDEAGAAVPPGIYRINAAINIDGQSVAQNTMAKVKVESVTLNQSGGEPQLNLHGAGSIPISQVKEIM